MARVTDWRFSTPPQGTRFITVITEQQTAMIAEMRMFSFVHSGSRAGMAIR